MLTLAYMGPDQMVLLIPLMGITAGIVAIVAGHLQTMEKIRQKAKGDLSDAVRTELAQLRSEMQALRETSTKFDISFDAALTSLEDRMERVEQRQTVGRYQTEEPASTTLRQG